MRSLIDIMDFSPEELQELIDTANDIIERPEAYRDVCRGKKLATLFFEPSTRTRLSFEAAMPRLPKAKALQILPKSSAVMPTSSPCGIRKRAPRWLPR